MARCILNSHCPIGAVCRHLAPSCVASMLMENGYACVEIHKEGQHKEKEAAVAARVRLGEEEGPQQGQGDNGGERSSQKRELVPPLTQEEIIKLRRYMGGWPDLPGAQK